MHLFDDHDDCAKTLGDSKPKHYHMYLFTESKIKPQSHKPIKPQSQIHVFTKLVSTVTLLLKSSFFVDHGHHTNV